MKKIPLICSITLFFGFLLCSQLIIAQEYQGTWLPLTVKATVKWEGILKGSDGRPLQKTSGKYDIVIDGLLRLNERSSPVISKGGIDIMPVLAYEGDILNVTLEYEEDWDDISENRACINSLIKSFKGNAFQKVRFGPTLTISRFSSAMQPLLKNLSEEQKKYMLNSGQSNIMPDYYQIAIGGADNIRTGTSQVKRDEKIKTIPKSMGEVNITGLSGEIPALGGAQDISTIIPQEIQVQGKRLKPDCNYEDIEKRFPGFAIGFQIKLPESGQMKGKETWQADSDGNYPPTFGIYVSDMAKFGGEEEPLSPPSKINGDVTYSVEWDFGDPVNINTEK